MRKADIVKRVAEYTGITHLEAQKGFDAVFYFVKEALSKGDPVILRRFGAFHVRHKKKRVGRNPKTGEEAIVPAKKVTTFKPGNYFREMINPNPH